MADIFSEAKKMRDAWASGDAERDKGYKRADVKALTDIEYTLSKDEKEKGFHLMDIYYPKDKDVQKYPVIVSIHGGGWFYGDKELYSLYTTYLATFGFAVVNFNYRLSPEYKYPAGFEDVCALMDYLVENADTYKLDLDRFYVLGDSAGAQLTNQYSIYVANDKYRKLFDFGDKYKVIKPAKIALNCGIYDMKTVYPKDRLFCDWYLPEDMSENLKNSFWENLSYINDEYPDTYLMLSVNDERAEHTEPLRKLLTDKGIGLKYREFGEDNKDDGHVFHLNMGSKNGVICNKEEIDFFEGE